MIQTNGYVIKDKGRLRKNIRKAIVSILKDKTSAENRVYSNPSIPPAEKELPIILVYSRTEPVEPLADAPRELIRRLGIIIEIIAKGSEDNLEVGTPENGVDPVDDILDDMAEQVEQAMSKDDTLLATCDDSILTNTEFEYESEGGLVIGALRLSYDVTYTTMSPRSSLDQGIKDSFLTNTVDYNISEDENTREATDKVDLPQS
jgi:hypothetical protein